jgi:hypothetical protein
VTDERRASPRLAASLAAELITDEGKTAIAITRDVSAGGLLVFTRFRAIEGTVKLRVMFESSEHFLTGTVLRHEPVTDSPLWRTQVAIAVDPNDPVLSKIFAHLETGTA